jgi:spermidine synthase
VFVVEDPNGERQLFSDSFSIAGNGTRYDYMRLLAHAPGLLAPATDRWLVVGFGTGTSAGSLTRHQPQQLDIVEISREILAAAPFFAADNRGLPAAVPPGIALRVFHDDGHHFLRVTPQRYDLILAEPPLPHLHGATRLYSADFYAACRARLVSGGVMAQWMPAHATRHEHYRAMLHSFLTVFPCSLLWVCDDTAFIVGAAQDGPWAVSTAAQMAERLSARPAVQAELTGVLLTRPAVAAAETLAALLGGCLHHGAALSALVADAPRISEDHPLLEYYGGGAHVKQALGENLGMLLAAVDDTSRCPLELDAQLEPLCASYRRSMVALVRGRIAQYEERGADAFASYVEALRLQRNHRRPALALERIGR